MSVFSEEDNSPTSQPVSSLSLEEPEGRSSLKVTPATLKKAIVICLASFATIVLAVAIILCINKFAKEDRSEILGLISSVDAEIEVVVAKFNDQFLRLEELTTVAKDQETTIAKLRDDVNDLTSVCEPLEGKLFEHMQKAFLKHTGLGRQIDQLERKMSKTANQARNQADIRGLKSRVTHLEAFESSVVRKIMTMTFEGAGANHRVNSVSAQIHGLCKLFTKAKLGERDSLTCIVESRAHLLDKGNGQGHLLLNKGLANMTRCRAPL